MYLGLTIISECMFSILYFRFVYQTFHLFSPGTMSTTFTNVSSELDLCPANYEWTHLDFCIPVLCQHALVDFCILFLHFVNVPGWRERMTGG